MTMPKKHPILSSLWMEHGTLKAHLATDDEPRVEIRYLDHVLEGVSLTQSQDGWQVSAPVPSAALSDGVHCLVLFDSDTSDKIGEFTFIAGAPAADDFRAEIALLRSELDMLKRAFRNAQTQHE